MCLKESLYSKKYSTGGQEEGMKRKYANTKDVQSVPKKFSDAVLALCNFVYCPEGQYLQCVANDHYFDAVQYEFKVKVKAIHRVTPNA